MVSIFRAVLVFFCVLGTVSAEIPQVPYLFNKTPLVEESGLVQHVKACLEASFNGKSKLSRKVLRLDGMSGKKTRHLLNNICSLPDCVYLEIGTWKGSTFVSALYENSTISQAVGIDNWVQFGGPKDVFLGNCRRFLRNVYNRCIEGDCFSINKTALFSAPVNVYFYDGGHEEIDQEKAFTYYNDILAPTFIAIVDDWNWDWIRKGTFQAFEKLHYQVVYECSLPQRTALDPLPNPKGESDKKNWWNGVYIAVIKKQE